MALNNRQRAFAREYLKDFNAKAAATRAGYSAKTAHAQGWRLLQHPDIQKVLAEYSEKADSEAIMSLRELQEWWTVVTRDGTEPVDGEGNEIVMTADMRERLKASEMLAKSLGGFTEKVENSGDLKISVVRE